VGSEWHPFPSFPWKSLQRPIGAAERVALARGLLALLRFQTDLRRWRPIHRAPDAAPFVSLYANGRLSGCQGSDEGPPPDRVARAFMKALHDGRFPPIMPAERATVAAQISYTLRPRLLNPEVAAEEIEIGTHGVAFVRDRHPSVMILPHVARDERIEARELLAALLRKARVPDGAWGDGALYAFEADHVVVHPVGSRRRSGSAGVEAAAAWLASLVGIDGAITFAVDPRTRRRVALGEMHHGRAAVVVQALAAHGGRRALVARARRRLERDIRRGLAGGAVDGWPENPELVAGTLALATLAGVPLHGELLAYVRAGHAPKGAWHGAQVVAALGAEAPPELWSACVADLERRPFAPWTLLAADALSDRAVRSRAARGVADAIRKDAPYRGGASVTPMPETALTALAVESLARHEAPWTRAAVARGRAFLIAMQLLERRVTAGLDPSSYGAFSASPSTDLLRCDISAHALLAIIAPGRKGRGRHG
jgi:AMMECR1 domain-containing protein